MMLLASTRTRPLFAISLVLGALLLQPAHADEKQELLQLRATTLALIEALVSQGLLTRERADALLRQAQGQTPSSPPQWGTPLKGAAPAAVVRVPYVPETMRQQMRDEIRNEVVTLARRERWGGEKSLPEWLDRISVGGDVRVRLEAQQFDSANLPADLFRSQTSSPAWAPDLNNTTNNRERLTLRARLGVEAQLSHNIMAGVRLSTGGATSGPSSASQTLGSQFNRSAIGLDRAWLRWQQWSDGLGFSVDAGRMANPFQNSEFAWPDDIAFDGVAGKWRHEFRKGSKLGATLGVFPVEELALSSQDKWLVGLQVSGETKLMDGLRVRGSLAAYDFKHMEGVRESEAPPAGPRAGTVSYFASQYPSSLRLKGNTLINLNDPSSSAAPTWGLAAKFRPVHLNSLFTVDVFDPWRLQFGLDWIKNTGFDAADISQRAGVDLSDLKDKTQAWQGRLSFGRNDMLPAGAWQLQLAYRQVERDAWVDGFTDTSWHLGGTNYKGWALGGNYVVAPNVNLGLRWISTRNLDDGARFLAVPGDSSSLSGNLSSAPLRIELLQLDLSTRF